ncbi:PKD domain-containing protein [Stigmatella sp. ncwal1]|uniref:PKD domain-containing protein n=1 Tax=Stigmatella ashevillensis TaxID=2995309 RepID=A0ABT5D616_9BACT|nr:PKD domain-containing protein [Stigmatella ashevillena]MDC0709109.1 PKD domain-containing protein [Stigmatella ashevillena]
MRNTPTPSGPPRRPGSRARFALLGVGAAALLLALVLSRWPPPGSEAPIHSPSPEERSPAALGERPSRPPAPSSSARLSPPAAPSPEDALSTALGEERVTLTSSVRIEGIEQDRPWVCAGEVMGLSAHLGGVAEPGSVTRWIWPVPGGHAELHPGPQLQWRAPPVAGRYPVRFQVCRDLGGRRVGVLAERQLELEVRPCGEEAGQRHEPLQIGVTQRGQGSFTFEALYRGDEPISAYTWDFGDGSRSTTAEPRMEHTYALSGLGPQEPRSFTVTLQARRERGQALKATTFVLMRGQPSSGPPSSVELQVSRWRPRTDEDGWRSDVVVRVSDNTAHTWERIERVFLRWAGEADIDVRPWNERVHVEETLEHGGFRGYVTVSPSEAGPEIKQILDFLYGRDATGQEVVVSWSPFKREPPAEPPKAQDLVPVK